MTNDFTNNSNETEAYYDIFEDFSLIEASFAQQYGIRLRNEDDMSWDEFKNLLSGLNGFTPLGGIVGIRSEKDQDRIRKFSADERRIHSEWKRKQMQATEKIHEKNKDNKDYKEKYDKMMDNLAKQIQVIAMNSKKK